MESVVQYLTERVGAVSLTQAEEVLGRVIRCVGTGTIYICGAEKHAVIAVVLGDTELASVAN